MSPLETYILFPLTALIIGGIVLAIILYAIEKNSEKKEREKISQAMRDPHHIFKILGWGLSKSKIELPKEPKIPLPPKEQEDEESPLPKLTLPTEEPTEPKTNAQQIEQPPADHVLYLSGDFSPEKVKKILEEKWNLKNSPSPQKFPGLLDQWKDPEGTQLLLFQTEEGKLYLELNGPQSKDLAQFLTYDLPVEERKEKKQTQ